jgi:asparagine synthase (glutamine-hydrolysing)
MTSAATQPLAAEPFPLRPPLYQAHTGEHGQAPGPLLPPRPGYSLAKLAAYFTGPPLYRDFRPDCPWTGIQVARQPPPAPGAGGDVLAFRLAFRDAVRQAVGGHGCVAVAFSGGMDSAAVLHAAAGICARDGRRLVAVTIDADDDDGRSTMRVARAVIDALQAGCELLPVDPAAPGWAEPAWTPHGPRFDSEPRQHTALAETASRAGAGVLLHGLGADQLLRAPRFLTGELLAAGRPSAAARFLADRRGDRELRGELAALPARSRPLSLATAPGATAYLAFARRDLCEDVAPVLTPAAARAARQWLAGAAAGLRAGHARERRSWATAAAVDALFPADPLEPSTGLPEIAPFFTPAVAASAWRIRVTDRYDQTLPTAYFRSKALVLGLLPGQVQQALIGRRQRSYRAFSRYWQAEGGSAPRLEELGLVRPDWLTHCRSAFDAAMVHACERWVTGAEQRGAAPAGDGL